MIDTTIVRAQQHSACAKTTDEQAQAFARSRGGLSTKVHATVDALGNQSHRLLHHQAHNLQGADVLLTHTRTNRHRRQKAYDVQARLIDPLLANGKAVLIPSRAPNKHLCEYDHDLCNARYLIENFFARIKQYRAIAARYDKTARNFLGAIHLAESIIWLA